MTIRKMNFTKKLLKSGKTVLDGPMKPMNNTGLTVKLKIYSHLSNKRGGWNKRGGGAKFAKSINVEVGINVKCEILWKKLMHNSNK